jgi:hypothetical protein
MPLRRASLPWLLIGAAAGLALYAAAIPALLALGVLERLGGSWTLHTTLLGATIAAALAAVRFSGAVRTAPKRTAIGAGLIGTGLSMFAWLEVDFHLLRVADTTTGVAELAVHVAGIAIASLGFGIAEGRSASALRPEHGRPEQLGES